MLKLLDISRFALMSLYFLYRIRICFTVSFSPQVSHGSGTARSIRYPWVSLIIRNLLMRKFPFFLNFLSDERTLYFSQFSDQFESVLFPFYFYYSFDLVLFISAFVVMLMDMVRCSLLWFFPFFSAALFSLMFQCQEIHIKTILIPLFFVSKFFFKLLVCLFTSFLYFVSFLEC